MQQKPGELTSLGQCKRNGLPGLRDMDLAPAGGGNLSALYRVCLALGPALCRDLGSPTPLQLRSSPAGPLLSPAQGESRNGAAALADTQSPSPDARARGHTTQVSLSGCSWALTSGSPGPGTRWLGMEAGKDYAALTCVAASYVSWSGLKPIWTFFGHWRKHLQNLKSERRGRERNGECAPQHRKKTVRTPPSAASVSRAGLWSPPKPSRIPATIPIPMPRLTLSRSALETTDFEKFRCKRGQGRGALEGRDMGE